jgi:hypothetical protein
MKRTTLVCIIILVSPVLRAQLLYQLSNRSVVDGVDAPVYDSRNALLTGTNFLVELWGGATPDLMRPAASLNVGGRRVFVTFLRPGYFFNANEIPVVKADAGTEFAWCIWDSQLAATYEEAVERGLGGYGESPLFYAKGAYDSPNGNPPAPLIGLQSFSLRPGKAVLIRSIRRDGDLIVMEWHSGFARYQMQQTSALDEPWENAGEWTTATSSTNLVTASARFFRLMAHAQ